MRYENKSCVRVLALSLLLIGAISSVAIRPAFAQKETGLDVRTSILQASYEALKEIPVMVSVIRDGQVVKQKEVRFNSNADFAVPPGLYDIRVEGDGMQTLVKRGIHVNAGERTDVIGGPMRTGTGVKIIEYATGGLSREEIAARIAKLEAALAELQKHQK